MSSKGYNVFDLDGTLYPGNFSEYLLENSSRLMITRVLEKIGILMRFRYCGFAGKEIDSTAESLIKHFGGLERFGVCPTSCILVSALPQSIVDVFCKLTNAAVGYGSQTSFGFVTADLYGRKIEVYKQIEAKHGRIIEVFSDSIADKCSTARFNHVTWNDKVCSFVSK